MYLVYLQISFSFGLGVIWAEKVPYLGILSGKLTIMKQKLSILRPEFYNLTHV